MSITPMNSPLPIVPNAPKRLRIHSIFELDGVSKLMLPDEDVIILSDSEEEVEPEEEVVVISDEEEVQPEEESEWPIRQGFCRYTLLDVVTEDNRERLNELLRLFTPSGQPQSEEEALYVECMQLCISRRIMHLNKN